MDYSSSCAVTNGNPAYDSGSGVVWVVAVTDGTFYGQAMTAGDIYVAAGGGTILGDGDPATSAQLRPTNCAWWRVITNTIM